MYRVTEKFKGNIRSLVGDAFSNEDFAKAMAAFEDLLNIEDRDSNFDAEYGEHLNSQLLDASWNTYSGCRIEGMLKKIEKLKGNDISGAMLQQYYTRLGFYRWLDDTEIMRARANDEANASNARNDRSREGFRLGEADASVYMNCPHFFGYYITAYQIRNRTKAHDTPEDKDLMKKLGYIKSIFIVYLDQCLKNYDLICGSYESELISKINYEAYAKDKLREFAKERDDFLQLNWQDEADDVFSYDYAKSVKFVGEAGMGKTTQMRQMYYQLLTEVAQGRRKMLPVWIELKALTDASCKLEKMLEKQLGEYAHDYSLLIERNVIALFLDGYNEILEENVRRKAALEIDTLHKNHPELLIALTDRSRKSNPPCLQKNIAVYTFKGLSREEIEKYVVLKCESENKEAALSYVRNAAWIYSVNMIPEKMNNLLELLSEGMKPESEDEFYDEYLEYILDREADEKKETRIEDLKYCLGELTQQMNDPRDEMTRNEIVKVWRSLLKDDLHMAQDLFELAIRLPILKPGSGNNTYMFVHPQYFVKCEVGF